MACHLSLAGSGVGHHGLPPSPPPSELGNGTKRSVLFSTIGRAHFPRLPGQLTVVKSSFIFELMPVWTVGPAVDVPHCFAGGWENVRYTFGTL